MYLEELIPGVCLESDKLECKARTSSTIFLFRMKSIMQTRFPCFGPFIPNTMMGRN